jgi:hypothetical protein
MFYLKGKKSFRGFNNLFFLHKREEVLKIMSNNYSSNLEREKK